MVADLKQFIPKFPVRYVTDAFFYKIIFQEFAKPTILADNYTEAGRCTFPKY